MKRCKVNPGCSVVSADKDGNRVLLEAGSTFETDDADAASLAESGSVSVVSSPSTTPVHDSVVKAATPNAGPLGPGATGGKPK